MCSAPPVLGYVQMGKPLHWGTDASDFAVSRVLSQVGDDGAMHPIGFCNRDLNGAEFRVILLGKGTCWQL
jgi:hypothetical protein